MSNNSKESGSSNVTRIRQMQESVSVEGHWKSLPKGARRFLLETPLESLDIHGFAKFWSSPLGVEYAWNSIKSTRLATRVFQASFSIALNYWRQGKMKESRALMLNGSFFVECIASGIQSIASWCNSHPSEPCPLKLATFSSAFYSVTTPRAMGSFLDRMHQSLQKSPEDVVESVNPTENFIYHPTKGTQEPSSKRSTGAQMQLILVDANTDDQQTLTIGSSTTLKILFNGYAEKRGVSLRSLRFVHNDKTLFLSSAGNRTPEELGMKDKDAITVRDTKNVPRETTSKISTKKNKSTPKKHAKKVNNSGKKMKGKGKKKCSEQKNESKTLEDYKAHHSIILSKLHEEVQPQLKEIRMRLNTLGLERQAPKRKRKNKRPNEVKSVECQMSLPNSGIGGKAGKPYFIVQVGEVQNLYKTTKSQQNSPCSAYTLDLHCFTREDALAKLDESLLTWVDTAMQGSYPFVIPAKIVCGCGNQVISEIVEKWIRNREQVANSPKGCF